MNTVIEVAVIGFGVVGAVVAGNAAAKLIERNAGSRSEQLAAGCVAAGLSAAVLPAAAVAGLAITCQKGYELYQNSASMKLHVAEARAKTLGTMDKVVNGTKSRKVQAVKA